MNPEELRGRQGASLSYASLSYVEDLSSSCEESPGGENGTCRAPSRDTEQTQGRKGHQRSSTAVRITDLRTPQEVSPRPNSAPADDSTRRPGPETGLPAGASGDTPDGTLGSPLDASDETISSRPSSLAAALPVARVTARNGDARRPREVASHGPAPRATWDGGRGGGIANRASLARPSALEFLDPDSPQVTAESIRASVQRASSHPPSLSLPGAFSVGQNELLTDIVGGWDDGHEAESAPGLGDSPRDRQPFRPTARLERHRRSYGTPEMPRGNAQLPHISPAALTPRVVPPAPGHAKHLPRAEKLPLTGYEQLASRLASQGSERSGPCLRPMYRRFEMLNHRLLLHLQDELCELEEQLHRLDTADTQNRRLQNGILPASRRAESQAGGELQFHRTDVLGKIGFKLEQYNRVLSSFQATAALQAPTLADVHEYRGYLATHAPVVDSETHFLDAAEDLVCVGVPSDDEYDENTPATPIPRRGSYTSIVDKPAHPDPPSTMPATWTLTHPAVSLTIGMAAAVALSTVTFSMIPGYLGRTSTVVAVGLGTAGVLARNRHIEQYPARDLCACAGVYGIVMAAVATVFR